MHQLLISSGLLFFYIAHIFIFFHSFFEGFDYHFSHQDVISPFLSLMPFSLPPYYSRSLSFSSCPSSPQPITAHFRRTENSRFGFQDFVNGCGGDGVTLRCRFREQPRWNTEKSKDRTSLSRLPLFRKKVENSFPFNKCLHVRKECWPLGAESEFVSLDGAPVPLPQ